MTDRSTVFVVLTPPGGAAVATIGLIGPQAWKIVQQSFRPARRSDLPATPDFEGFSYGQFGDLPGDAVVVAARPALAGVCVEIHCHGGPAVVAMIAAELIRRGARPSGPAEFLHLSGQSALTAVATIELTRASTLRTAAILLDQCDGAFERALSGVEAALAASDLAAAGAIVGNLTAHAALGRHLTRPWRIAIAGAPNVGKSSLVNALAGYQRSVVTDLPGTTRDLVVSALAIDGWPVELIDTAGQHSAGDPLEGQGIALARAAAAAAELCLWVVDVTAPPVWPGVDAGNCLFVINKTDLPALWDIGARPEAVITSARTGSGLAGLCDQISRRLVPDPPPPGTAIPFTPHLANELAVLAAAIAAGNVHAAHAALAALGHPMQSAPPA